MEQLRNEKFDAYYQTQQVVRPEEWEQMMRSFRTPLPLTFRVNARGKFTESTRRKLVEELFPAIVKQNPNMKPPKCLKWYPDALAWQIDVPKDGLKRPNDWSSGSPGARLETSARNDDSGMQTLRSFLIAANEVGAITRQEAVSMIPPLLLDVEPHHRVLDMCAAPGSKTFQLLEMLHAPRSGDGSFSGVPSGVVIANDASLRRANLLTHQTKRSNSPALIVTNHQAQEFPFLKDADDAEGSRGAASSTYRFDRVLADVPCSGDGTLRKSPDLWKKWSPASGVDLHSLQLEIATRAARLLKVGGRLVYSTCSLNPLEDEAVVASLVRRSRGALRVADVSAREPGLERRPGMLSWRVGDVFGWHDEGPADAAPGDHGNTRRKQRNVADTMYPPGLEKAKELGLERCVRILPHLDDTGGFFIVAIDKVAEMPGDEDGVRGGPDPKKDKNNRDGGGDDWNDSNGVAPVTQVEDEAIVQSMREQYGISAEAIAGIGKGLMTRASGVDKRNAPKRLYYVSPGARSLVAADGGAGGLRIVAAGVKAFERQAAPGAKCAYRLTQEGLESLLPRLEKQVVRASPAEVEAILRRQQGEPQTREAQRKNLLRDPDAPEGCWEKETLRAMKKVTPGCVVLVTRVRDGDEIGAPDEREPPRKKDKNDEKNKRDKKHKKDKRDKRNKRDERDEKDEKDEKDADENRSFSSVTRWAGVAGPNDLAVACWLGEGDKGRSLSVLATKAEGGHLLHQLKERSGSE